MSPETGREGAGTLTGHDALNVRVAVRTRTGRLVRLGQALEENHPNPFNPVAAIHYTHPARGHVSMRLYDLVGRFASPAFVRRSVLQPRVPPIV